MKKTSVLTILSMIALWLTSCYKDLPNDDSPYQPIDYTVLPPITRIGANTFGCLVNGEVWVPRVDILAFDPTRYDMIATVDERNGTGVVRIDCTLLDLDLGQDDWLEIISGPTFFQAVQNCDPIVGVSAQLKITSGQGYQSSYHSSSDNCVTITRIDTANNIISGTFQFVLYNDFTNLNDKITITEGRFDMPYRPQ